MTQTASSLSASLLTFLVAASALVACGGGSADGSETSPSALAARMSKCPALTVTQDDTAATCLIGSYEGETLAGEACSLGVLANNAFEFISPKLSVSFTAPAGKAFVYSYTSIQEVNQLFWSVSEPFSAATYYNLDFTAGWGANYPATDRKITIEVAENTADVDTTVVCVVKL